MQRSTVLLLFGGESSEHDVSIASARNVYEAIDTAKYDVRLGYIDRSGRWWSRAEIDDHSTTHDSQRLVPVLGKGYFASMSGAAVVKPDVILPILHGKNGEDGTVQGLAQMLHIPIVGCDLTASVLCMDKAVTKEILRANGIAIVPYERHVSGQEVPSYNELSVRLGSPLFVKPSRAGSSVGISKVVNEEELSPALALAHQHDDVALVEAGVTAREIEVAVLGNPPYHQASVAGEIRPGGDFYSYDAKYSPDSQSQVIVSADLTPCQMQSVRDLALRVYELLGCRGLARVDFFLLADGMVYVNEINTLPGFTNISMYPKLWQVEGIEYPDLLDRLISLALTPTIKTKQTEV